VEDTYFVTIVIILHFQTKMLHRTKPLFFNLQTRPQKPEIFLLRHQDKSNKLLSNNEFN